MIGLLSLAQVFGVEVNGCDPGVCDLGPNVPTVKADSSQIASILQLVFMAIGIIAMIYIIIAGLRMITSLGEDPEAVKKLRQSIIYAAVGLAICLSAELLISLVINKL
jgi:TRAP-type C4-dicarboxylate transport system permease small subunit